jgi:hypothetical protein
VDRRAFLAGTGAVLLAAPLAVEAHQAGTMPRVGSLEAGSRSVNLHFADAFAQGLHEVGYTEEQNTRIEERWADGRPERFPDLVADLLKLKVDVTAHVPYGRGCGALRWAARRRGADGEEGPSNRTSKRRFTGHC